MHRKTYLLIFITLAVILTAIGYYFWESFLYLHYLGGFDPYGLPVQLTYPGYGFFFYSWPLWGFPLFLLLLISAIFYLHIMMTTRDKIKQLESKLQQQKNEMESYNAVQLTKKSDAESRMRNQHEKLQKEYASLQSEYQRSLDFIEKMLEQTAEGKKKEK